MKIMYYTPYTHTVAEMKSMFEAFKDAAEKEGEIAIALPNDIVALQSIPTGQLMSICNTIKQEIERRK